MSNQAFKAGLEDVVALSSDICFIDGDEALLTYRGFNINDLARHATFEEVVYLLWHGRLPNRAQLAELKGQIAAERALPREILAWLGSLPKDAAPMSVVRTGVSALALYDPEADATDEAANLRKAVRILARIPTLIAAFDRIRRGEAPVAPRADLADAANFLYMLRGEAPKELVARVFDVCLILHADHELNASTFAARVTAATLSDIYSAITSAVGALKGPLHGGANQEVMRTLIEIGDPDKVEQWTRDALAAKRRIMGFGHRVYRNGDPRAAHLKNFSEQLAEQTGEGKWYEMSSRLEATVAEEKPGLYPNVDFYSASTYYMMGIPIDLYTPIFAVSRIAGWTAHVLEQYHNNRLIRPRAEYTGPKHQTWVPIEQRS
ncbi:MAG TPA: citrate synthase [Limnochordia bacterium]|nr:citrate synthase [Limnochordia bacterium]